MPSIDVIIPYFKDTEGREELLNYTADRWIELHHKTHGARVYASDDGGPGRPFNRGLARNRAAELGRGEWLALWDTDVPPPSDNRLSSAIRTAGKYGWSPVWSRTLMFNPEGTRRLLDTGASFEPGPEDYHVELQVCMGPVIVKRRVFEAVGGYDTRYVGWGWEDSALRSVLSALYGQPPPPSREEACWSLTLDPHTDKRAEGTPNRELYLREYKGLDRGAALNLVQRLHAARPNPS